MVSQVMISKLNYLSTISFEISFFSFTITTRLASKYLEQYVDKPIDGMTNKYLKQMFSFQVITK